MDAVGIFNLIRPYLGEYLREQTGSGGSVAPGVHGLDSVYHSGTLRDAQGPQFALLDGTRTYTGDITLLPGLLVDGVDVSEHVIDRNAHHSAFSGLLDSDDEAIDPDAGDRIKIAGSGAIDAQAGTNLLTVSLKTPGTLSASSSNSNVAAHTHAIINTSDGRNNPNTLLKSAANGGLSLGPVDIAYAGEGPLLLVGGGTGILNVNQHWYDPPGEAGGFYVGHVGVNCDPDPQFDLDVAGNFRCQGWMVGKMALQISNTLMIVHYDGWINAVDEQETEFGGDPQGHQGQVATITGNVLYRRIPALDPSGALIDLGKAVQPSPATTNYVTNPSAETNATGYGLGNAGTGASLNRWPVAARLGEYGLRMIVGSSPTSPSYIYHNVNTDPGSAGTQWTYSCYFRAVASAIGKRAYLGINEVGGGYTRGPDIVLTGDWQHASVTHTVTDSASTYLQPVLYLVSPAEGDRLDTDGWQVEQSAYATPYHDGSLTYPATWSGTAHASTSSRAASWLTYPTTKLPIEKGTAMAWVMLPDVPNTGVGKCLFSHGPNTASGLSCHISVANTLSFYMGTTLLRSVAVNSVNFAPNVWHHVAVTWDKVNNVSRLYLDGTQVGADASYVTPTDNGQGWRVGALGSTGSYAWPGWIDEFVVCTDAKSPALIRAIYESKAPVFAESSVFHFRNAPGVVWADEAGLWVRTATGDAVLGVYAGQTSSYAWGGKSLNTGDVLLGRHDRNYLWWQNNAGRLVMRGTLQTADAVGDGIYGSGPGVKLSEDGLLAYNQSGTEIIKTFALVADELVWGQYGEGIPPLTSDPLQAGDMVLGDPSRVHLLYDASEGIMQFKHGKSVHVAINAEGKLMTGRGTHIFDESGFTIKDDGSTYLYRWYDPDERLISADAVLYSDPPTEVQRVIAVATDDVYEYGSSLRLEAQMGTLRDFHWLPSINAYGYIDIRTDYIQIAGPAVHISSRLTDGTDVTQVTLMTLGGNAIRIPDNVPLYVGQLFDDNTRMTTGITINQLSADDEILTFKSSDVNHGMTELTETDTFGYVRKLFGDTGGLFVRGFSEATVGLALAGVGVTDNTSKTTTADGYIRLAAYKKSSTGSGNCGSDANLLVVRNNTTTRFIFDAEGSLHCDVEATTFDEHDDVALLDTLERTLQAHRRGESSRADREALEALKLASFDENGHAMVNLTRWLMLVSGAIRQTDDRVRRRVA